jgi:hypothetical protein
MRRNLKIVRDQIHFGQTAETPLKEISSSGAISSDSWAWVELNYRPHAYQATEGEQEVRQETCKSLTDGVICRCSPFAMPDNVVLNRQQNRQQGALLASAGRCPNPRYSIGFSSVMELKGIETRPSTISAPTAKARASSARASTQTSWGRRKREAQSNPRRSFSCVTGLPGNRGSCHPRHKSPPRRRAR